MISNLSIFNLDLKKTSKNIYQNLVLKPIVSDKCTSTVNPRLKRLQDNKIPQ